MQINADEEKETYPLALYPSSSAFICGKMLFFSSLYLLRVLRTAIRQFRRAPRRFRGPRKHAGQAPIRFS
jgi:hypothetical protein